MKKLSLITFLISVILLSGCSKDEPRISSVPLISKIIVIKENDEPIYINLNYDKKNRLTDYTYEADKIHYKSTETYPNGSPKEEKIIYLDDSRKAYQFYDALKDYHYLSTFSYDSQNRISKIVSNRREVNENGEVVNSYSQFSNSQIEWDNNNNVQKITHNYQKNVSFIEKHIEYTSVKNTLSLKNVGLDFFGKYVPFLPVDFIKD